MRVLTLAQEPDIVVDDEFENIQVEDGFQLDGPSCRSASLHLHAPQAVRKVEDRFGTESSESYIDI